MGALFFLAFAYFAVGQAAVTRNGAQTAADAAALAAARDARDGIETDFLKALKAGDLAALGKLLQGEGIDGGGACAAAGNYAAANGATLTCPDTNGPLSYTVAVETTGTVGKSVVNGTESMHAKANATAVIEPLCTVGGKSGGDAITFTCKGGKVTVDPTVDNFKVHLAEFFSVHLSQ